MRLFLFSMKAMCFSQRQVVGRLPGDYHDVAFELDLRELALLNIAAAHAQKGDVAEAKSYYERMGREFPDNEYAGSIARFIAAASDATET